MRNLTFLNTIILFLFFTTVIFANNPTTNGSSTNWNTASAWTPNGVPNLTHWKGLQDVVVSHNMDVVGSLVITSSNSIHVTNGATLTIKGNLDFRNGAVILVDAGSALIVTGKFHGAYGHTATINGTLDVGGNYKVTNGAFKHKINGKVTVGGYFQVQVGKVDVSSALDITGKLELLSGGRMQGSSGHVTYGSYNIKENNYLICGDINYSTCWNCTNLPPDNGMDFSTCGAYTLPVCDNFTNAGSINGAQTSCGSYNPSNMGNANSPSGGSGDTQYQWQYKTTESWVDIGSANSATYDPSTISITTQYQRGARRSGCSNYVFTTSITKAVDNQIIASNTTSTASITELQTKSLEGSPSGGTWSIVSGGGSITGATYSPADITADTSIEIKYTIASDGSCAAATSDCTFTVTPVVISWDGSKDNDWSTPENWSTNTVPANNNAVVVIPSGLSNYPTASGPVSVNSVIMNSGSSFIAKSTFEGSLTYNRTLSANWHLVSSPVAGETLQGMIENNSFVLGKTKDIVGLAPYLNDSNSWDYLPKNSTGAFTAAGGYSAKLAVAGDVSFTGTMPTEDSSVAINQGTTNNYNLVGNPYPSFVTVTALLTANESRLIEKTLWVWHPNDNSGAGAYSIVNAVTGIAYIAPAQGFFVSANADNIFSFTEKMQSHQSTDTFPKTATETRPEINVLMTIGTERSDTDIFYIEGTTTGFDTGYDSSIFEGSALGFSLYTHAVTNSTGRKLGVQTLPNSGYEAMVIPLGVKAVSGAEITFSAAATYLPIGINVFLEDREANVFTELTDSNANYKVRLTEGAAELGRFYLHTKQQVLSVAEKEALSKVKIYKTTNTNLRVTGMSQGKAIVKVYNVVGQELMRTSFVSSSVSNIGLPNLSKGVYLVKLETEAGILNKKIVIE